MSCKKCNHKHYSVTGICTSQSCCCILKETELTEKNTKKNNKIGGYTYLKKPELLKLL